MNDQTTAIGGMVAAILVLREVIVFLMAKMKRSNGASDFYEDVSALKTDVAVIKQDVHWLKEALRNR